MATTFHLDIVTPVGAVYSGDVVSLIAPGTEGYLGVLAHHAPLVTALKDGTVTIRDAHGAQTEHHISGGFLEVSHNQATILADALATR
jgi:F-type H+-transporting ATPase subunit epsilon